MTMTNPDRPVADAVAAVAELSEAERRLSIAAASSVMPE